MTSTCLVLFISQITTNLFVFLFTIVADIKHLASESDVQATKTSKDTKEPLRKTSSDTKGTESSKRSFKTPATSTEKHNETSDKTKTFTRQGSKVGYNICWLFYTQSINFSI